MLFVLPILPSKILESGDLGFRRLLCTKLLGIFTYY